MMHIRGHVYIFDHSLPAPIPLHRLGIHVREGTARNLQILDNLVTDIGLDAIAALLGGGFGTPDVGGDTYAPGTVCRGDLTPPGGVFVERMDLGVTVSPPAPLPTDTALYGPTAWQARIRDSELMVSYPATGIVAFTTLIPAGTLDDEDFTEEGLFTPAGKLISRRLITPAHHKPVGEQTQVVHTLEIERA